MNDQANSFMDEPTDEDCFLFTSESVGEGHPGKFWLRLLPCVVVLALISLIKPPLASQTAGSVWRLAAAALGSDSNRSTHLRNAKKRQYRLVKQKNRAFESSHRASPGLFVPVSQTPSCVFWRNQIYTSRNQRPHFGLLICQTGPYFMPIHHTKQ